jgi:hypothetical protein
MSADGEGAAWHLTRDGRQYGPYQFAVLIEAARRGVIAANDLIWRPGWDAWRQAHSVDGLFDVLAPANSAPPPSSDAENAAQSRTPEVGGVDRPSPATTRRNYFVRHWQGQL